MAKPRWDIRAAIDGEEIMLTNIAAKGSKVVTTALQLARRIANSTHGKGHGKDVRVITYSRAWGKDSKPAPTKTAALPPPTPPVNIKPVLTPAVLEAAFDYTPATDEETEDEPSPDSN